MADYVLLRFRDLVTNIDTIAAHNAIVAHEGKVLWGWWKKPPEPLPDPGLSKLRSDFRSGEKRIFFINSSNSRLYTASLYAIYYSPGGLEIPPPDPRLCPDYYREKSLPAWFEVGEIQEIEKGIGALASFVFSYNNRSEPSRTITALHSSELGQNVLDIEFLDSNISLWLITPVDELGVIERSSIVPPMTRSVYPVKGRYALHLSDLHFGQHHAFRNELSGKGNARIAKETLLEALRNDLNSVGLDEDSVALILVTGDLTWTGEAHEFQNALQFLEGIGRVYGLHPSQLFVIPGNHDIEWRDDKGDIDPNAELNYSNFYRSFYNAPPDPSFLRFQRFRICERTVCVLGLNSCRIESKTNAGLGFVGQEQFNTFWRYFRHTNTFEDELRIALAHHHLLPVNYVEDIDWDTKRVSITLDADGVIRNLVAAGFHIVLHGHQHQPYISELRRIVQGYVTPVGSSGSLTSESVLDGKIAIVGAGSIGVERSHHNLIGRNAYNIIDLGQKDSVVIRTRIQSPVGPGFIDFQNVRITV